MMDFITYDIEQLKKGYTYDGETEMFHCLICDQTFEKHEIFKIDERFFDAQGMMQHHIRGKHESVHHYLLGLDKKVTGLTDHQKKMLMSIQSGMADKEVAEQLSISPNTVRHFRFTMKEKARQAKAFLALYELTFLEPQTFVPVHAHATMVDDRYVTTEDEQEKILKNLFVSLEPLKLKVFSSKEKKKLVILKKIAESFTHGRTYTEMEVNEHLKEIYTDFATIRRYLIEYKFMARSKDGMSYWII
jgi:Uncharacterized protein conserved in bacteria